MVHHLVYKAMFDHLYSLTSWVAGTSLLYMYWQLGACPNYKQIDTTKPPIPTNSASSHSIHNRFRRVNLFCWIFKSSRSQSLNEFSLIITINWWLLIICAQPHMGDILWGVLQQLMASRVQCHIMPWKD